MKVLFSHPTGNSNVRAAATGLWKAGMLGSFHTSIATFPGDMLDLLSNLTPLKELRRRRFNPAFQSLTHKWPWIEIGRLLSVRAGIKKFVRHENGFFCIDAVYRNHDKHVASNLKQGSRNGVHAVYAYEDAALLSLNEAKRLGLKCLYDLPIGYWRTAHNLLKQENERWPDWSSTLTGFNDSELKLARKDEELRLADRIFVASSFTAKTLQDFPGTLAPIEIIPYGFPEVGVIRNYSSASKRALKLLFVGGLSQRKGIANLFAAVDQFEKHVALTVVGHKPDRECTALNAALKKHRWIASLPHEDILALMKENDVLVFPSLFEGFGLVISEAMSQGTPVITTDRTAGPDLINPGQNGWLIEAGSTTALCCAIEALLCDPKLIIKAGREARETAVSRPWSKYGKDLAESVSRYLKNG